ncbi:Mss51 like protein [Phytophthora palmivora]|uniref:Mss51 like protein n=1 Tax=Phytophthora palmivora TaxID=4796 RepID=A0A2P4XZM3_9STRA|nr:Mss51 like protein [Phytophthora palmivora]
MFKQLLLHRPLFVRCISARQLRVPGAQSLVGAVGRLPCLQCGHQTALSLSRSSDMSDVLAERVDCGHKQLPLACSKNCADKLEEVKPEVLTLYDSMVEDIEYSATPEASKLFSEVMQQNRRESSEWGGDLHLTSWTDYLKLYHPDECWLEDPKALRLLSSAYSYVMTLSRFLPELMEVDTMKSEKKFDIHVIGARAEAMMPRYLWDELSFFHPGRQFGIKLVGDHVPVMSARKKTPTTRENENEFIQLEMINGLYHKIEETKLGTPDAFVLYNPGVGHPHLRESWEPTLQAVLASGKPVLITSFSLEDQQRDITALQELVANSPVLKQHELRFRCRAKQNSFRSLKYQLDPSNVDTPIQTNNRVMVVQLGTDDKESTSWQ